MVCQSVRESSQKYKQISLFFEDFCRFFFLPQVLAAEGGYMPTEEVVQLSKFVDVSHKVWDVVGIVVMANQPMKARVVWNLLEFPGLFLVFLIALE